MNASCQGILNCSYFRSIDLVIIIILANLYIELSICSSNYQLFKLKIGPLLSNQI